MARKSGSSSRWLARQRKDSYVKQAQDEGWRSRAVYKLQAIDRRDGLLRPGMTVVDLGAAPGGWCQYAHSRLKARGRVVGLDILPITPLPGVDFIEGDFLAADCEQQLKDVLADAVPDLVLSDMAPNFTGVRGVDMARAYELAELAADFAVQNLKPGGRFLVKVFQDGAFQAFRERLRRDFRLVDQRKPAASRQQSAEIYLLAQDLKSSRPGRQGTSDEVNEEF